jgi:hypothetical protein
MPRKNPVSLKRWIGIAGDHGCGHSEDPCCSYASFGALGHRHVLLPTFVLHLRQKDARCINMSTMKRGFKTQVRLRNGTNLLSHRHEPSP